MVRRAQIAHLVSRPLPAALTPLEQVIMHHAEALFSSSSSTRMWRPINDERNSKAPDDWALLTSEQKQGVVLFGLLNTAETPLGFAKVHKHRHRHLPQPPDVPENKLHLPSLRRYANGLLGDSYGPTDHHRLYLSFSGGLHTTVREI